MSIYEKRWHYSVGSVSHYTDSVEEVLRAIRDDGVTHVSDGYADIEYVADTATQIGGTLYTRRTDRVLTAAEFVRERQDLHALLTAVEPAWEALRALDTRLNITSNAPDVRKEVTAARDALRAVENALTEAYRPKEQTHA